MFNLRTCDMYLLSKYRSSFEFKEFKLSFLISIFPLTTLKCTDFVQIIIDSV